MSEIECRERLTQFLQRRLEETGTINAMMSMRLEEYDYENKRVVLAFPVEQWQLNPIGNMHGGMICTAFDIAMGCIAYISGKAVFTPTTQMSVSFIRPVGLYDTLLVEAICDHVGGRLAQIRAVASVMSTNEIVSSALGSYIMNI